MQMSMLSLCVYYDLYAAAEEMSRCRVVAFEKNWPPAKSCSKYRSIRSDDFSAKKEENLIVIELADIKFR